MIYKLLYISVSYWRVPNRFFGIRDLAFLKPGIRDFGKKWGARFGIVILNGTRDLAI